MTIGEDHRREHEMIAEAIKEDRLYRDKLLVHLASWHGRGVEHVGNDGMVPLVAKHDAAHQKTDVLGVVPKA